MDSYYFPFFTFLIPYSKSFADVSLGLQQSLQQIPYSFHRPWRWLLFPGTPQTLWLVVRVNSTSQPLGGGGGDFAVSPSDAHTMMTAGADPAPFPVGGSGLYSKIVLADINMACNVILSPWSYLTIWIKGIVCCKLLTHRVKYWLTGNPHNNLLMCRLKWQVSSSQASLMEQKRTLTTFERCSFARYLPFLASGEVT